MSDPAGQSHLFDLAADAFEGCRPLTAAPPRIGCPVVAPVAPGLTIVIPVYNERATVLELIERVREVPFDAAGGCELIVVDDGSTDGTRELLDALADVTGGDSLRVLHHAANCGKGWAIRTGLAAARGRFVVVQDADLEYDPQQLPGLLEPLLAGTAQVVYGSRYLKGKTNVNGSGDVNGGRNRKGGRDARGPRGGDNGRLFRHGVRLLNLVVRLLYGVWLTDEATCYKMLPTELLRRLDLQCARFEFCPELTAKLCRLGIPIVERPISYVPRGKSEGKKLRLRDGWVAIATLWRHRHWRGEAG